LARVALRGNVDAHTALGLKGKRKESHGAYISQGLLFYNNASDTDAPYAVALAAKGISTGALEAGAAHFRNLQKLLETRRKKAGEAQKATADRNALYKSRRMWMSSYRHTARIVLRTHPQLSVQLGNVQR